MRQTITLKCRLMMGKRGWTFIYQPVVTRSNQSINELQRFIMKKIGYKEDEKRIILSPNPNTFRCVLEILHEKC